MNANKVAILTRPRYRSPLFLAHSLSRMLTILGVSNKIYQTGISHLEKQEQTSSVRRIIGDIKRNNIFTELKSCDLIILTDTIRAYTDNVDISGLSALGKPIMYYGVFYAGGSQYWLDRLPENPLDKFDVHLSVSAVNDIEPSVCNNAYPIGMNLPANIFNTHRNEFLALIDYAQPGYENERAIQIQALETLSIPFVVLDKEYTFQQIEDIYNRCSVAFVAFPESFGVPILEQQHLGVKVISPHRHWVKRHALYTDYSVFDNESSEFSDNFIFYNGQDSLIEQLGQLKSSYEPSETRSIFLENQPEMCGGSLGNLWRAINKYL